MAYYSYKARTPEGKIEKGAARADSKEELIRKLKEQNLFCVSIKDKIEEDSKKHNAPLKLKVLANFCHQLAALLHSGVTITKALDIIYQSTKKKKQKVIMLNLYEGVSSGQALSVTMSSMGKTFPELLIYMIETGETSGTLDQIMKNMAEHFEKEAEIKSKVQTAMIYPAILIVVSTLCVLFMLTYVLPQFMTMFENIELPWSTKLLLALSDLIRVYWVLGVVIILLLIILWTFLMTRHNFKREVDKIKLKLPIIGKLIKTILTSRFASTFSILYRSGISILHSLDITSRVLGNIFMEEELTKVSEGLRRGEMLSKGLMDTGLFNPIFLSMVLVGEESGGLDDVLARTGDYFQKEANNAIIKLIALVEPIMIVVLGVIIGFIVISIILPIFSMYNSIL